MPTQRVSTKRRAAAPAPECTVCIPCSTVPFGHLNLVCLMSAIVCVLSVFVVIGTLVIQTQNAQIRRLSQITASATTQP